MPPMPPMMPMQHMLMPPGMPSGPIPPPPMMQPPPPTTEAPPVPKSEPKKRSAVRETSWKMPEVTTSAPGLSHCGATGRNSAMDLGVQVELGEPCATLYVSNLNEKIKPKGAATGTGRTVLSATLKMLHGVLYRACCMLHAVSLCACAELPLALYSVFHHFGPILDIQTRKTQALKGQVWVRCS